MTLTFSLLLHLLSNHNFYGFSEISKVIEIAHGGDRGSIKNNIRQFYANRMDLNYVAYI